MVWYPKLKEAGTSASAITSFGGMNGVIFIDRLSSLLAVLSHNLLFLAVSFRTESECHEIQRI